MIVGLSMELFEGAVLSIPAALPNNALICLKLPPSAQTPLIPHKKKEPDGLEQLLGGQRMSAEMPGVPVAVYLVLQVTAVNSAKRCVGACCIHGCL